MARTKQGERRRRPVRPRQTPRPPSPYYTKSFNANDRIGSYNPLLPPVFPIRVGALCDIAAVSFAASLMQYKLGLIRKHSGDDDKSKLLDVQKTPETDFVSVALPTVVKERTTILLLNMHESLDEWKNYHYRMIFWDKPEDIEVCGWLDEIVWTSNGSISYGQTAEKMLHSGKMVLINKYRLACVYCFEDSVKNLASKVGNDLLKQDLKEHSSTLFLYWYWYSSKPCYAYLALISEDLVYNRNANFNAIEYVWSNVDSEERMGKESEIGILCNPLFTWRVLIDLNASEFDVVIEEDGLRILQCLKEDCQFWEVAVTIWRYMLDRIMDDTILVDRFFAVRDKGGFYDAEHETHLIQQMWHYAPQRLRSAITEKIK